MENQTIERTILSNLINNEEFARKVLPFIKADYFDVKEERIIFDEIQKSNMSKLSIDGTPVIREDGKILKGPNYFKPNIKGILDS